MRKCSVLVASLLSLFILFSFRGYAIEYSVNSTSPDNNTVYDHSAVYYFNITWVNTIPDEPLTEVNFALVRPDDLTTVYTLTTNSINISNNSSTLPSETWITFTQDQLGPAGNYSYSWSASNGAAWNTTFPTTMYYVQKAEASINLYLNGSTNNQTSYYPNSTINATAVSSISGLYVQLWGNNTLLDNETNVSWNITQWPVRNNNFTAVVVGGQNYTDSAPVTLWWNVSNDIPPTYSGGNVNTSIVGQPASFTLNWFDNYQLAGYIFSTNNTGAWVNSSYVNFSGTSNTSQSVTILNSTVGTVVGWLFYASDTFGNLSASSIVTFPVYFANGYSPCTVDTQCIYGHCVHSFCRDSSPYCGDGHCDTGEICTSDNSGCSSGYSCTNGCVAPVTTTPPSTGPSTPTGSFLISGLTSSLTVVAGQSASTPFTLSDTLSNNIVNVSISVSGIDSSWYTLSNSTISILKRNVPQPMTITFKIPSSAEAKSYDVTISAKGKALGETSSRTATKTMTLIVNSSQPQPIQPMPSQNVTSSPESNVVENKTQNITSNQTSVVTGLAPAFEFFKNNLVIILAVAACLLIFIFRNNLTTALTGTLGKEEPEARKAKTASPLKGIKDKLNYKLVVNLKKESKAKNLKEPTEIQGAEKVPEMVPEKQPKRPAVLEKEIKRDIKELQSILDAEKKVGKNKKKFNLGNN